MREPRAYYNEHDKFAAAWLRNLIAAGHIAPGDVDERDIRDVRPSDLRGYVQCHFFAGVGVWSYSLRRAGWPDRRPVWSASCPCQPFSAAGKSGGFDDERHLWPAFFHLVEQCGPRELFGEQVASKDGLAWLDLVHADMEGAGYAFGALDLCAAGFGAPHIRQRLYWLAYADIDGRAPGSEGRETVGHWPPAWPDSGTRGLADAHHHRHEGRAFEAVLGTGRREEGHAAGRSGGSLAEQQSGLGHTYDERSGRHTGTVSSAEGSAERGVRRLANSGQSAGAVGALADTRDGQLSQPWRGPQERNGHGPDRSNTPTGPVNGVWRNADWLLCRDGKWRPVRSGSFPLAHGVASRVGKLRAYGNAIVAPQAEEFIGAYLDAESDRHFQLSLTGGIFA